MMGYQNPFLNPYGYGQGVQGMQPGMQQQPAQPQQRAVDGVNYNGAINTAAINANTTAQVQKVLDAIMGNRMADMQSQINALQLQNATANVLRFPNAWTFNGGVFPPAAAAA